MDELELGRKVTAFTSQPGNQATLRGGDAGAWIGEMAFLDWYWNKGKRSESNDDCLPAATALPSESLRTTELSQATAKPRTTDRGAKVAIHTIFAKTDCELMQWRHEDLNELMGKSVDLQSALVRSMTAAIVGKVVNLTVSRSSQLRLGSLLQNVLGAFGNNNNKS